MLKNIILGLSMGYSLTIVAQESVSLRSIPFTTSFKSNIYIHSVVDNREKKNLGTHKNLASEEVYLQLTPLAEQAIGNFYSLSFPEDSQSTPIVIEIRALNVQASKRRMNDGIAEVARTHVSLVFFEVQDGNIKELYRINHNEDEIFDLFDRASVYATHEKRIRAALEYCMHAFLNNYETIKPRLEDSTFIPFHENKKIEKQLGQWFNLLTLKGFQSRYFSGYGISYTGFVDSKKGWIKPYETSFEVSWAQQDVAESNSYSEVNAYVFRPELYFFYKKLFNGVYASVSANVPVGFETLLDLEGDNSLNFVIGVGASQGIRIITWKKNGLVIGADFFQQFETSKVYDLDWGVELVLGINF